MINEKDINKASINLFNINPVDEIQRANQDNKSSSVEINKNKAYLYKINLKDKINAVPLTNIIFYDNQNKTLPVGMDLSTQILVDINKIELSQKENFDFNYITFENESDEFSNIIINKVNVLEFDV